MSSLFPDPPASAQIELRDYQLASIEGLRNGIRAGHDSQILVAPTGGGKTVIGSFLLNEAEKKGSKAIFVVDRVSLCDQTSAALDKYGIPHGVIQSGHWRFRPEERIQVATAQTLEKRGIDPDVKLLIVDEAHCVREFIAEYIKANPKIRVVGLTATPFAKGLATLYKNLVNVTTTNKLIADGWLCPLKVYIATAPDMTGAKLVAGEWTASEAGKRGTKIIGDIVAEWQDKTVKHFGGPVKTIVFSASVDHGEELCRQFQAAGHNFQQISYKDSDDDRRRALIDEYRKPDSSITGLISCEALCLDSQTEILTRRGWATIDDMSPDDRVASFDADSGVISFAPPKNIIRRPKGAGERMVSAESKKVSIRVTEGHRMLVPVGERPRGHSPLRWKFVSAVECAGKAGTAIPVSGDASPARFTMIQEAELPLGRRLSANSYVLRRQGYSEVEAEREALARIQARASMKRKAPHELSLDECRLIGFWLGDGSIQKLANGGTTYTFCQSLRYAPIVEWFDGVIARVGVDATRNVIPKEKVAKATQDVVKWAIPRGTGFGAQKRNGLFALEPYLNKSGSDLFWGLNREQFLALIEGFDFADGIHYRHPSRPVTNPRITNTCKPLLDLLQAIGVCRGCRISIGKGCTSGRSKPLYYMTVKAGHGHLNNALRNAKVDAGVDGEMVWCVETVDGTIVTRRNGRVTIMGNCKGFDVPDILCGIAARPYRKSLSGHIQMLGRAMRSYPGKSYAVWLDHAGNYARFFKDVEDIFENGVQSLDDAELDAKVRPDPTEEERDDIRCSSCGFVLMPSQKVCPACGHERIRRAMIETQPGVMVEVGKTHPKLPDYLQSKAHVWSQICTLAMHRKGGDAEAAKKFAKAQYRNIYQSWPNFTFETDCRTPVSEPVKSYVTSRLIAYAKAQARKAA